jgi:hypothetical protein
MGEDSMSAEPEKFFVGVVELFSILLPGAVFAYLVKDRAGSVLIGPEYARLPEVEAWAVFLVASYLLGHFIFLIGAWLLDDIYDDARDATPQGQIERLADGEKLSSWFARQLARWLFKKEDNRAVRLAQRIKEAHLGSANARAINTFQWSKARLLLHRRMRGRWRACRFRFSSLRSGATPISASRRPIRRTAS